MANIDRPTLLKGFSDFYPDFIEKSSILQNEFDDFIEKGKAAMVGEIRTWGGQQYVKHADGWVHIHPKTGKVSILPTSGTVRKIDGNDDHKAHYRDHINGKGVGSIKHDSLIKPMSTVHFTHKGKTLIGVTGKYDKDTDTHEIHVNKDENNKSSGIYRRKTEQLKEGYPDNKKQSEFKNLRDEFSKHRNALKTETVGSDSYNDRKKALAIIKDKLSDKEPIQLNSGVLKHLGPVSENEDEYELTHGPTGKSKTVFRVSTRKSDVGGKNYIAHDISKVSGGNNLYYNDIADIKNNIISHRKKIVERDSII